MSPLTPPGPSDRAAAIDAIAARIAAVGSGGAGDAETDTDRSLGGTSVVPPGDQSAGEVFRARDIVYRQLATAPRPRAVLENKLRQREISDEVAAIVLDRFEKAGLIDDRAYAELYVITKHRDRALGRHALRAELRRQGVAESDYSEAVAGIDTDAEAARAVALLAKRVGAAMAAGPDAARRRLLGLLARRGYPPGLAGRVVDQVIDEYSAECSDCVHP
jgi:regulatory protein